ncbi:MAG: zinc metallopeptidase [Clostridia bacterium]|nr:zinc metallopeptidase [Clostridia bacterium]
MPDFVYLILLFAVMILSFIAQGRVQSVFNTHAQVPARSGVTGARLAQELLYRNGLNLPVQPVQGTLTDHYDPKNQVVGLSQAVYGSNSVSALAVAAHEIGHVLQHNEDYAPMKLRSVILPAANIGSRIGPFLVLGGLLLSYIAQGTGNAGYYIALVGVGLYVMMLLFQLVTLPVEFNASKRGLEMLTDGGYLAEDELPGAKKMLRAAAMTYVLAALGSFVTVLRLLSIAGRARRR